MGLQLRTRVLPISLCCENFLLVFPLLKVSAWYVLCRHAKVLNKAQSMLTKVENYDKSWNPHTPASVTKGSIDWTPSLGVMKKEKNFPLKYLFHSNSLSGDKEYDWEKMFHQSENFYTNILLVFVACDLTTLFDTLVTPSPPLQACLPIYIILSTSGEL